MMQPLSVALFTFYRTVSTGWTRQDLCSAHSLNNAMRCIGRFWPVTLMYLGKRLSLWIKGGRKKGGFTAGIEGWNLALASSSVLKTEQNVAFN